MTNVALRFPLEDAVGYQIRRAASRIMADLGRLLGPADLTVVEATVLILINSNPDVSQSAVGREIGMKSANLAPIMAKLAGRGLVERTWFDGRSLTLRTNAVGAAAADDALKLIEGYEAEITSSIAPALLAPTAGILKKLAQKR